MPFYLGKLGALRALPDPADLDASPERIGGVHRSLTGATTADTLGRKKTWKMAWPALKPDDFAYLDALSQGAVPGPLRFVDHGQRNRMSPQHSTAGGHRRSTEGFTATLGTLLWASSGFPDASWAYAPHRINWSVPVTGGGVLKTSTVEADRYPLVTGEQVAASLWIAGNLNARMQLIPYDVAGVAGTAISSGTVALSGFPQRLSVNITPSSTQVSCVLAVDVPTGQAAGLVDVSALQLEVGAAASTWVPGEGCPVVVVDQMSDAYPLAPYHTAGLTLLEV